MRTHLLALFPLLALSVTAQQGERSADDATAAARKRLTAALRKACDTPATAFTLRWGPRKQEGDAAANDPLQALLGGGTTGSASGAWFEDLRHVKFDGPENDELLLRATHMIARDATRPWTRRTARFADGNTIDFLPDPAALLAQLAEWPLAVTRRDAGAIDDRPVEIVSVTLNHDQVGELLWSGALPPAVATPGAGANRIFVQRILGGRRGGGAAARPAATPPDVTVDLAIAIDPGTGLVHEVRVRSWGKAGDAGGNVLVQGGRVQVVVGGAGAGEPAAKEQAQPEGQGPLDYEHGLPVRGGDQMVAFDVVLRLSEHGAAAAPTLTEEQRRMLR